jgi:phytoene dehydrogenase-like protein
MSIADLLDDWFENDRLKGALSALACTDVCQGPMASGTAFSFMHRHVGASEGVIGQRLRHREGPRAVIRALEARARTLGVTIETGTAVRRLQVKDNQVTGATLATGEDIACARAISSLDPYRSLLEIVDPAWLDPEFILAVRNIRFRGVTTKILLALDGLPGLPGVASLGGTLVLAPSIRHVERACDAAKYGRASTDPVLEVQIPSLVQPHLAPTGKHVAVVSVQYTPYRLRESTWNDLGNEVAERALALLERCWPGFGSRVTQRRIMTPPDLEAEFGVREGSVSQGELMLDQILFMRPVPGAARGETPIGGYSLCGPGTHPGPGLLGI